MTLPRDKLKIIVAELKEQNVLEVSNENGFLTYFAVFGKKTPVDWALYVFQNKQWGKTSPLSKMSFIEDAVRNCKNKPKNEDLEDLKEDIEGLGFERKKEWLNFWSSVEHIREETLLPIKSGAKEKMIELGFLVEEEPIKEAQNDCEDGAMNVSEGDANDVAEDDVTSGASVKKSGARKGKKHKRDTEKDSKQGMVKLPEIAYKYWPDTPKDATELLELKAFEVPVVEKDGKVVPHTYGVPVSKRINGKLVTGILQYCPCPMAMAFTKDPPSIITTPEETMRVAKFDKIEDAIEHNKMYADMLQDNTAFIIRDNEEFTVRQFSQDACTGDIRNRAGHQRFVDTKARTFSSIGDQVGHGLKIVLANRIDANGKTYRTIEDANTSSTALGGFLSTKRKVAPTMHDANFVEREVSQQQLGRLQHKMVKAVVMTGDDADMD